MAKGLRSLRMKGLKAPGQDGMKSGGELAPSHLSTVKVDEDVTHGLVDSGATGTSREITDSSRAKVQLAVGETDLFISKLRTLPILPMAALPALGCAIVWSDKGVNITHPVKGSLPVRLNGLCPEMPKSVILQLIAEYGSSQREQQDLTARKLLCGKPCQLDPVWSQGRLLCIGCSRSLWLCK